MTFDVSPNHMTLTIYALFIYTYSILNCRVCVTPKLLRVLVVHRQLKNSVLLHNKGSIPMQIIFIRKLK